MPKSWDVNVWNKNYTVKELKQIRRELAKDANRALSVLEKHKSELTGERYTHVGSARILIEQTRTRYGGKKRRVPESTKINNNTLLKKEISQIQKFLNSKSSTVKGWKEIEDKRMDFWESTGIQFATNKQFFDFLGSYAWKELSKIVGSERLVEDLLPQASEKMGVKKLERIVNEFLDDSSKQVEINDARAFKDLANRLGVKPF